MNPLLPSHRFPHENTHDNLFIGVPYSASDTPVNGSTFSDLDITILSSILSQLYSKLRVIDVKIKIIPHIKKIYNNTKKILPDETIVNMFKWFSYLNLTHASDIELVNLKNDKMITDITNDLNSNPLTGEIKLLYLKEIIIPEIDYTLKLYNCSFIDIMSSTFTKLKGGFSGTVNINLPYYDETSLLSKTRKIDAELLSMMGGEVSNCEYTDILYNSLDNGAIHAALLGTFNNKFDEDNSLQSIDTFDNNIIENMVTYMYSGIIKIECLIDAGAFFSNYSIEDVINKIATIIHDKYNVPYKEYIYIDSFDVKRVLTNDNGSIKITRYNNIVYPNAFIYYDNRHIIGIDIKQPANMLGVVTINKFSKYTEISQAIFRMRNLNNGHEICFAYNNQLQLRNRMDVYNFIWKHERIHLHTSYEQKKLTQNLKYLCRKNNDIPVSYEETTLIPYKEYSNIEDKLKSDEKYSYKFGDEEKIFIDRHWCKSDNVLIIRLCDILKNKIEQNMTRISLGMTNIQHELAVDSDVQIDQEEDQEEDKDISILIDMMINIEKKYEGLECESIKVNDAIDYTIEKYLNFSDTLQFSVDSYDINSKGIYFSPQLLNLVNIQLDSKGIDDESYLLDLTKPLYKKFGKLKYEDMRAIDFDMHDKFAKFLQKLVKGYLLTDIGGNYIRKDGKYLLLTNYEARIILKGITYMEHVPLFDMLDATGKIIFSNTDVTVHESLPIELFIQYLLGNRHYGNNLAQFIKYVGENNDKYKLTRFCLCVELLMGHIRDKHEFHLFLEQSTYDLLKSEITSLSNMDLLEKIVEAKIRSNSDSHKYIGIIDKFISDFKLAIGV